VLPALPALDVLGLLGAFAQLAAQAHLVEDEVQDDFRAFPELGVQVEVVFDGPRIPSPPARPLVVLNPSGQLPSVPRTASLGERAGPVGLAHGTPPSMRN